MILNWDPEGEKEPGFKEQKGEHSQPGNSTFTDPGGRRWVAPAHVAKDKWQQVMSPRWAGPGFVNQDKKSRFDSEYNTKLFSLFSKWNEMWHNLNYVLKEYLFLTWGNGLEDSMGVGRVLGEQLAASSWKPGQELWVWVRSRVDGFGTRLLERTIRTCWWMDVGNEGKHNPQLSGINSRVGSNDIYWDEEEEEKQVWRETKSFTLNVWSVR